MATLSAPEIQRYCETLSHRLSASFQNSIIFDARTYQILDTIFDQIKQIVPREGTTDIRDLWLRTPRGSIEQFGDYQEWLENEKVSSYEEFQEIWLSCFPDEEYWYSCTIIERKEEQYRAILLNHKMIIEQRGRSPAGVPLAIHEFSEWLLWSVNVCVDALKAGTYNQFIASHLPLQHRIGTILRKDWWSIFPENRKEFFSGFSQKDADSFVKYMGKIGRQDTVVPPLKEMSANDYFRMCAIGYAANHYSGGDRTPREQYYLHADGRDDGLSEIDPDSPFAFFSWFTNPDRRGGQPWEIVRGGNSTHISLYPQYEENGFTFLLAGSSVGRTIETVKFYLALRKAGLPVCIEDGSILADRLTGNEKIGIVPQGVLPAYCENLFPGERITSFMNLGHEKLDEIVQYCTWQPIPHIKLQM